ncbi:tRNA (guanine-N(1)-)-methyltransferase [Candidatus Ecksteinia adelgidicola]|nr:tRNA (guanine-N(1)-)-methyltransferase [Candidatus Ecksteinia adelgidicola]
MLISIISLFPKIFHAITNYGITSQAVKNGLLKLKYWNPRDFTYDQHHTVDARPYGGGPGMLLMAEPLREAIHAAKNMLGERKKIIYLSPQGKKLDQNSVYDLSNNQNIILVCGRYEGIDNRIIETEIDEEYSIGDYILSNGELPAMVLIDAIARITPGVLNNIKSTKEESFTNGLLDFPNYTRPKILSGLQVPPVLLSGNHDKIRKWRLKQSLGYTWLKRPDLLENLILTEEQITLLNQFKKEH